MKRHSPGANILLVDDDLAFRLSTAELLRQDGYRVTVAADGAEAVAALEQIKFDLMLLDVRMPGIDGVALVEVLRQRGEGVPILMISGFGTVDTAVRALHLGADDFLTKPMEPDVLSARVAELLERRPSVRTAGEGAPPGMVGHSARMREVFDAIRTVAPAPTTVLVTGETGTGKELVARAIHELSPRRSGPFVPVNCASLAEGVLESELFGHVRGAFTGALRDRQGLFQSAGGGTIFLDEIGDVNATVQQRLLRVLQEREVTPVGATRSIRVDVRVVAATNQDLQAAIAAGRFREDLFYRLNVFRIDVPPLRERRRDIPLLVEAALERMARAHGHAGRQSCSPFAMRMLQAYDWPGNVRELLAALESAAIRASGGRVEAQHLPAEVRAAVGGAAGAVERYREAGADDERTAIVAALEDAGGVRARAAELLGMGRTTLWRKLKKYGLDASTST
jgi:two-component system response regulator AtoC